MKTMFKHLLFSVALLSFVFSYSTYSLWSSSHYSLELLYSKYLCFLGSSCMNKNCWFLVFNGLLIVIAKTSGFAMPPAHPPPGEGFGGIDGSMETALEVSEPEALYDEDREESGGFGDVKEDREESDGFGDVKDDQSLVQIDGGMHEGQNVCPNDDYDGDHGDDGNDNNDDDDDDDDNNNDYDGDDETEALSVEELNKKFEEFIRRMKEEIRVDEILHQQRQQRHQQQLVVVK